MQFAFGSGALWGERTDVTGSGIGPRQFAVLQDVQVSFDWTDKPLYGQFQFAQVVARGQGKITCSAKFAQVFGLLYSDIFFGSTPAIGQFTVQQYEINIVPTLAPYIIAVGNAGSFFDDLGVTYLNGTRFSRVSPPAQAGQYSAGPTGAYTFSSVDAGTQVSISYTYNAAGVGTKVPILNQLAGVTPMFKATLYSTYGKEGVALRLNACTANKLMLPLKVAEWMIQDLEFEAFADSGGVVGYISTVE
jgi:hypothetical protein